MPYIETRVIKKLLTKLETQLAARTQSAGEEQVVNLKSFVEGTSRRLVPSFHGARSKDKIRFLTHGLLRSCPRTVRKISAVDKTVMRMVPSLRGSVIDVGGVEYVLVDEESLTIVQPSFESWTRDYLHLRSGDTFLDVGAHVGKYTLSAAKILKEGLVIAIEASPENYATLKESIQLNGFENIWTFNMAAWNEDCEVELHLGDLHGHNSVRGDIRYGNGAKLEEMGCGKVKVRAERLDHLLDRTSAPDIDWIKIDVEGAEYEVLEGLSEHLLRNDAKLVVEVQPANKSKVIAFMKNAKYVGESVPDSEGFYFFFQKQ